MKKNTKISANTKKRLESTKNYINISKIIYNIKMKY